MTPQARQEADLISAAVDLGAIPPEGEDVHPHHMADLSCRTAWAILRRLPAPIRLEAVLEELDRVPDWRAADPPGLWLSKVKDPQRDEAIDQVAEWLQAQHRTIPRAPKVEVAP